MKTLTLRIPVHQFDIITMSARHQKRSTNAQILFMLQSYIDSMETSPRHQNGGKVTSPAKAKSPTAKPVDALGDEIDMEGIDGFL
jgi:hypothetical protein